MYFDGRRIIKDLWQQPLSGIDESFTKNIAVLNGRSSSSITLDFCSGLVRQCRVIHAYLSRFFVPLSCDFLLYAPSACSVSDPNQFQSLMAYWKKRNFAPLYSFYMLYFDCVARLFIVAMHTAYAYRAESSYAQIYAKAQAYFYEMTAISKIFQETEYEERYVRHINRYNDLVEFMQAERDRNV